MPDSFSPGTIGRSGLQAAKLGIACGYGAPTQVYEEAFERGINYFYLGGFRKKDLMVSAIRGLAEDDQLQLHSKGQRLGWLRADGHPG